MNNMHSHARKSQVKLGACQALAHFRRVLAVDTPLSRNERDGLCDLLTYMEEHLLAMWRFVDEDEQVTQHVTDKLK